MAIKITVTSSRTPNGKSSTTFGTGGVLINKGTLLRIQDSVKDPKSPVNAQVRLALEKAAKVKIKATRDLSLTHYAKTLDAVKSLVRNSGVAAVRGKKKQRYEDRVMINAGVKVPFGDTRVVNVPWKTLNYDYFYKMPRSTRFFKKRQGMMNTSSRELMLQELNHVKIDRVRSYSDVPTAKTTGKASTTLKYSYTLQFPSLGKYNFIRQAYLNRKSQQIVDSVDKNHGILYAERLRPFFRVLAAEAGNDLRKQLTLKLK